MANQDSSASLPTRLEVLEPRVKIGRPPTTLLPPHYFPFYGESISELLDARNHDKTKNYNVIDF